LPPLAQTPRSTQPAFAESPPIITHAIMGRRLNPLLAGFAALFTTLLLVATAQAQGFQESYCSNQNTAGSSASKSGTNPDTPCANPPQLICSGTATANVPNTAKALDLLLLLSSSTGTAGAPTTSRSNNSMLSVNAIRAAQAILTRIAAPSPTIHLSTSRSAATSLLAQQEGLPRRRSRLQPS
jgi:hypothetical protein